MDSIAFRGQEFPSSHYSKDEFGIRSHFAESNERFLPDTREQRKIIDRYGNIIHQRSGDSHRIISQDVANEPRTSVQDWTERAGNWYLERYGTEEDLSDRGDAGQRHQHHPKQRSEPQSYYSFISDVGTEYHGWWKPRMDMLEDHAAGLLKIEFEMPGVSKDDIILDAEADRLTVRTVKEMSLAEKGGYYFHSERHFGNYYRRVGLPYWVDPHTAKAVLEHGVLKVTLRKSRSGGDSIDHITVR
jgi:HSP20 family molecular chaperone IbpA